MPDDPQPKLPMDLTETAERVRRRRRRSRRRLPRSRRGEQTPTLMQSPVIERCARCGHRQTVMGDAAVCDGCGGMVFRCTAEDDE
jgi:hypothetical protein